MPCDEDVARGKPSAPSPGRKSGEKITRILAGVRFRAARRKCQAASSGTSSSRYNQKNAPGSPEDNALRSAAMLTLSPPVHTHTAEKIQIGRTVMGCNIHQQWCQHVEGQQYQYRPESIAEKGQPQSQLPQRTPPATGPPIGDGQGQKGYHQEHISHPFAVKQPARIEFSFGCLFGSCAP